MFLRLDIYTSLKIIQRIFQRILSLNDNSFESIKETGLSFAPTNEVYWMRVTLKNTSKKQQDILVSMEYPLMNLLQFYTVSNQQIDSSKLMGDNFPFYHRPIEHHYFLHRFEIKNDEVIDLYVYFHKANENLQLFTSIWTEDSFNKTDKKIRLSGVFILVCRCASS